MDRRDAMGLARSAWRSGKWGVARAIHPPATARQVYQPYTVDGGYSCRLLRVEDQAGWTASRLVNEKRMRDWWPEAEDWERQSGRQAFSDHYLSWTRRSLRGEALPLALVGPDGFVGELLTWQLHAGGTHGEMGPWARPGGLPSTAMLAMAAGHLDNLFGRLGLGRVSAVTATGNRHPLRVLEVLGFQHEGTLTKLRPVRGALHDHEMHAITRERWIERRPDCYARHRWSTIHGDLPPLDVTGGPAVPGDG